MLFFLSEGGEDFHKAEVSVQDCSWMMQQNLNAGVIPSTVMLVWLNPVTKQLARAISGSVRALACPPKGHRVTARTPLASLPSWSQILVGKRPELNSWPSRKSPEQRNCISEASHSWRRGRASASLGRCSPRSKDTGVTRTTQSILAFLPPWKGIPASRYRPIAVLPFLQGLAV